MINQFFSSIRSLIRGLRSLFKERHSSCVSVRWEQIPFTFHMDWISNNPPVVQQSQVEALRPSCLHSSRHLLCRCSTCIVRESL